MVMMAMMAMMVMMMMMIVTMTIMTYHDHDEGQHDKAKEKKQVGILLFNNRLRVINFKKS
jgi:uncharacterized membrane protein